MRMIWWPVFNIKVNGKAFRRELEKRLKKFHLMLHPDKTRLIEFGRFAQANREQRGERKPETFDFLGFTHVCSKRHSDDKFTVRRYTIAKRQRAKLKEIRHWLKKNRHLPVADQGRRIAQVITGAMNYYGVPGNRGALDAFRTEICRSWLAALRRRSQKASKLTWDTFKRIVRQWVPSIRVIHPYPNERLCV